MKFPVMVLKMEVLIYLHLVSHTGQITITDLNISDNTVR